MGMTWQQQQAEMDAAKNAPPPPSITRDFTPPPPTQPQPTQGQPMNGGTTQQQPQQQPASQPAKVDNSTLFQQEIGRPLTDIETNWINQGGNINDYINGLKSYSQQILSNAQNIYGLKNFTIDDANKLRDSLYQVGDVNSHNSFWQRTDAALQQKTVQEQQNPTVSPDQLAKNQGTVADIFQQTLGRPPTRYETDHFAKQLAQGDDPLILQQTLQQSGEYLDKKAAAFRDQQAQQLQGYQAQAFDRAAPSIIGSYMKAGRLNSSGTSAALAQAAKELTDQNSQYLTGLSREDFLNSQGQAQNIFAQNTLPSVQRAQALTGLQYKLPYQAGSDLATRNNEISDYFQQQNDFNRYLQANKDAANTAGRYSLYGAGISGALSGAGAYYGNKAKVA